jgi:CubicO group peptidase (beta-lactamase class C family)
MFDELLVVLRGTDDDGLNAFILERIHPDHVAAEGVEALTARLQAMRQSVGGRTGGVDIHGTPGDVVVEIEEAGVQIQVGFAGSPPRITALDLRAAPEDVAPPLTWETLEERLREAGFSGVVLARRGGAVVHLDAYGMADREEGRPTSPETVYGIGSTPIDFTMVAVLLLAERGELTLDDPIGRFLPAVPDDKRGITIRHLMSGRSGLDDFHDVPEVDWDPDLAWIDRGTAVERILARPLLFTPGDGHAHSHSAFGLLAAIVEIASGRSYPDFVREEILAPAGMTRTGFYGETLGLGRTDFAVGSGPSAVGLPNIPPNWGPTSWLVMGSGGMFSTLGDMDRFLAALSEGRIVRDGWRQWLGGEIVNVGGSDRGFYLFYAADGTGDSVLLMMNGDGRAPETRSLSRALEGLVMADPDAAD